MKQTPIHDGYNPDLLNMIPLTAKNIIEIGCSSGALAREFKKRVDNVNWVGVEIDPNYAEIAKKYCEETLVQNIDNCDKNFYNHFSDRDCWVFGDTLEHLKDPWAVLNKIRNIIPQGGVLVSCIPNAQHWSLVIRLAIGNFTYEDSGLLDRTHLRWFTRKTIYELFESQGFCVTDCRPRIFQEPGRENFLPAISEIAKACGVDPNYVLNDVMPLQYVVKAIPV